jgi:hypothetical protein
VPLIPPLVSIHTLALGVICILSRLCMVCSYALLGARALVAFVAVILLTSLVVALGEFVLRVGALFDDSCVVVLFFPDGSALITFYFPLVSVVVVFLCSCGHASCETFMMLLLLPYGRLAMLSSLWKPHSFQPFHSEERSLLIGYKVLYSGTDIVKCK